MTERTQAQTMRQSIRKGGRYSTASPCEECGRGVVDYYSTPQPNTQAPDGTYLGGLVLCHRKKCTDAAMRRGIEHGFDWPVR